MNRQAIIRKIGRVANSILAMEFPTQDALKEYLKEHPDADPRHHSVAPQQQRKPAEQEKPTERKKAPEQKPTEQKQVPERKKIPEQKGKYFTDEEMALSDTAEQDVHDEEGVYAQAEEAQEQMMDWLDKGKGIDKKLGLKHFDLSKSSEINLDESGPVLITAPIKGKERAEEKVQSDYGGNWSRLVDAVRATIAVDNPDELDNVVKTLKESGMKMARKPKDRIQSPSVSGYRDLMINVKYPNGHVGELQIHLKQMLKAKEQLGGHKLYEQVRTIKSKATEEGRKDLSNDEQKIVDDLEHKMNELYEGAWKDITERKASMGAKTAAEKTRYFEYNGSPAIYERNKFPVIHTDGKEIVFRDFWKFLHNATEIDKAEYDKMIKGKSPTKASARLTQIANRIAMG